jgi:MoaA/NifB/PqqE/SkfB family radical SAM enzyme
MQSFRVASSARKAMYALEINPNRTIGREMVPVHPDILNVETTSVCNLSCRFCAYDKKTTPRISMTDELFFDCIEQAVALGYRRFALTPSTGDIFMDHHIFRKLAFLDDHPGVEAYSFYTNFTIPKSKDVDRLIACRKLTSLVISVYGHDPQSFNAITGGTEKLHARLMGNLERLLAVVHRRSFHLTVRMQSTKDAPAKASAEVADVFDRLRRAGVRLNRSTLFHTWGGLVTEEDVKGLAIDIKPADTVYKLGACTLLFTGVQIMATGVVHACNCVDVDATLEIGNLHQKPLRDIISTRNPLYMRLIEEQQRGEFRPVCRACGFYKSIYHMRRGPTQTVAGYMEQLDAKERGLPQPV